MRNLEAFIPMDFALSSLEARMLSLFEMSMMPINRNSVMKNKLPRHIEGEGPVGFLDFGKTVFDSTNYVCYMSNGESKLVRVAF